MTSEALTMLALILLMVVVGCALMYLYMIWKQKNEEVKGNSSSTNNNSTVGATTKLSKNSYTKLSIEGFMDFDKIEDNMIVQNGGKRFLMVIECEGINYDLMSGIEKTAVESGFVQFLNTLRHPIQIYTQTRTIDITQSIETYKSKVNELKVEMELKQRKYNELVKSEQAEKQHIQKAKRELARIQNLYDYGIDIVKNIEKTSQNKNVLRKHYYIIIPYYTAESTMELLDEEEKRNMIFSELYTRSQAIIRTLFACSIKSRILNPMELAELLYVAYNREESEIYGIEKATRAGYDEMYSTAPDVLDKRIEELDKEIQERAMKLAEETVYKVRTEKQKKVQKKEESFEDLIKQLAEKIVQDNKPYIGQDVAEDAIKEIKGEANKKGGEALNEEKTKKRTRRTTKSNN